MQFFWDSFWLKHIYIQNTFCILFSSAFFTISFRQTELHLFWIIPYVIACFMCKKAEDWNQPVGLYCHEYILHFLFISDIAAESERKVDHRCVMNIKYCVCKHIHIPIVQLLLDQMMWCHIICILACCCCKGSFVLSRCSYVFRKYWQITQVFGLFNSVTFRYC